jgi:N utilization substance protein B
MRQRRPSATARRSAARLAAVQALYQVDLAGGDPEAVLGEFVRYRFGQEVDGDRYVEPDPVLFGAILRGVAGRRQTVDDLLRGSLDPQWSLDRVELLLASILRAGAWELLGNPEVPARIVIADYVKLSQAFYGGKEPGMVNGVLDHVARTVRAAELAGPADPARA